MSLSLSKFNMWRTIVSLSHSDGVFHNKEEKYLANLFEGIGLSAEQLTQLQSDLTNPQDSKEMFDGITEDSDRAQLFYYGRMLLWADGDFSSSEEEVFNKLKGLTLDKVDFEAVMDKVKQVAFDYDIKAQAQKEARPLHRKIIDALIFWEELP